MKKRSDTKVSEKPVVKVISQGPVTVIEEELFPDRGSKSLNVQTPDTPTNGSTADKTVGDLPDLSIGNGFDSIVRSVFDVEADRAEYMRLRDDLSFTESVTSIGYGRLADALDVAQKNRMRARDLYALMKVTAARHEITCKAILATYREKATADLTAQKNAGTFPKAITNDDVEAVMARMYPKEWHATQQSLKESEEFVKLLAALEESWADRAKNLQQLVARSRDVA